jgi:hypothetical protein
VATDILVFDFELLIGAQCALLNGTTLHLIDYPHDAALDNRNAGERKGR